MPELPEVEIVVRALHEAVKGKRIESVELRRPRLAPHTTPEEFTGLLRDCRINSVARRGKYILIDLDNGRTLLTHLRMSGRFVLLPTHGDFPKFAHAIFHLKGGCRLVFDDQRHFGLMKVVQTTDLATEPTLSTLAPEPFSEDFSPAYLQHTLARSARSLKEFLLDQTKVCGLGNIYAAEAMFRSGISPRRRAKNVPRSRVEPLFNSIRAVLTEALEIGGSRSPDPVFIGESVYDNGIRSDWAVYEREGSPCFECGNLIRRIRQGARSTYYCPRCQR